MLRFSLLGALEVTRGGASLPLGAPLQRAVLARLLVEGGQVVSVDRLVDDLWGERPPAQVEASLQAYVANLRRILEPDRAPRTPAAVLRTRTPGYLVDLAGHAVDHRDFEAAADEVRRLAAAGHHREVRVAADAALAHWRGPALADLADAFPFASREADRLATLRTAVEELRLTALVHGGDHLQAVAELDALVRAEPFRERAWELLVLALYRAGRTAEALERCRQAVAILRDELGVDPGRSLRELQAAVLARDPALDARSDAPAHAVVTIGGPPPTGTEVATDPTLPAPAVPPAAPVPPRRPPLIGRDDDATAVAGLLGTSRLVTITGPGGVGKTSLALRVADRVAERHPDGTVLAELAAVRDPALLVPTVARTLALQDVSDDPIARTAAALRDRRVLLVLDNLEQLLDAAPDVARLLDACPQLTVLATSRARLAVGGEREFPLAPLELPHADRVEDVVASPAVQLFLARAAAVLPSFAPSDDDARAIAAICRQLDGLPLAIELAAPWLKVLAPQDLEDRLADALATPIAGARDLADRHKTLRDTVAWSHRLLDPEQQRVFLALSVLRSDWSLEAAAAVVGASDPASVLGVLAVLVEHSLVVRVPDVDDGGSRYRLLETVRAFGQHQLAALGRLDEVRARHAAWIRAVSEEAHTGLGGHDQLAWLRRLTAEQADLDAGLAHLLERGDAAGVVAVLWNLRWYFHITGRHREVERWLAGVAALPAVPAAVRARARIVAGFGAYAEGRYDEVPGATGQPLEQVTADAEPDAAATAVLLAAHAAVGRHDVPMARDLATEAATRARAVGDRWEESIALLTFAQVTSAANIAEGLQRLGEAEAAMRRCGASWGIAVVLNIRAMLGQIAGEPTEVVRPLLRENLEYTAAGVELASLVYVVTSVAVECVRAGEWLPAAELFGAVERLDELTGLAQAPLASRQLRDDALVALHAQLGPEELAGPWAAGRARSLPEIIELAVTHCG